ncbi:hypothetical protein C2G38_2206777 [Gigaspora rosea]|uniref:Uncharacterized protein n=1 Tax=Gigaspora rosea TaxID=44941 RepID=A0A397UJ85_9GLOM|nr:hypothetical protein C2G38_2206777 [Gigaspora rosea]
MAEKNFVAPKACLHDAYVSSKPIKEWHNIDSYVSKLLEDNPKGPEKQYWLKTQKKSSSINITMRRLKLTALKLKKTIQHQRTAVSAITLVTKEIDELSSRKCQRGEEPQTPENIVVILYYVYSATKMSSLPLMYQFYQEGEPSNGRLLRETKKICYVESSSSDLEDVEESKKPIKNKNVRSQQYVRNNFISHERTPPPTVPSATNT